MATLAVIRSRVSKEIGLDETAAGAEETLVDAWANQAVLDFMHKTKITIVPRSVAGGTAQDVALPAATVVVKDIAIFTTTGSVYRPLKQVSVSELLNERKVPGAGPARLWAQAGNYILYYPTPTAAETITYYEVIAPTVMSSGSHDPSNATYGTIPATFHDTLILYVLWKAASYADDESSQYGLVYRQQYLEEIARVALADPVLQEQLMAEVERIQQQLGKRAVPAQENR